MKDLLFYALSYGLMAIVLGLLIGIIQEIVNLLSGDSDD